MQVAKWGNSLAVKLPAAVVDALQLKEGDDIKIHIAGSRAFEIEKKADAQELLAQSNRVAANHVYSNAGSGKTNFVVILPPDYSHHHPALCRKPHAG